MRIPDINLSMDVWGDFFGLSEDNTFGLNTNYLGVETE